MTFFVTGTDTDCGKTLISSALLTAAKGETLGFKPIASGCAVTENGLRNSDALTLMEASTIKLPYEDINPYAFEPAIAPHIAATEKGVDLLPNRIAAQLKMAEYVGADFCVIEGAGGWRLPLSQGHFLSEVVQSMQLPVILVVGMKLGCLNHALLTAEAIRADGLNIVGWIANQVDPDMANQQENLAFLKDTLKAPFIGYVPYLAEPSASAVAEYLDLTQLS
ncbi:MULTISPECIES: dethiobiotin synthase [Shewanella]|uniref:ATP-dependent dethiobiotin synthetase BioD n=1 Tax=Shewanella fidelis TaxID=173509 RepID=A0AAW8NNQ0_9GAMM|nr:MULTISPECIES: dethiobiotin synthase [Shewanella]MDR8523563.1 dethiobiotin synthase [Shewanella fidelis]MDW4810110.1 dethiobiotin synthase [Shewanella fidelis]MDW4814255.1 dethiobiotin synthase [Shewanella fidelis]MDW4818346.1 dethiobiotin synthase [Shewanella fidelis]MDW4824002.1 dethiobiotin synthase [Shewanella fidelis]